MLTKPEYGWSDFQLPGTSTYGLSYILGDLPFDWIEKAIHGLETQNPFRVTAYLEPGCFVCIVNLHNCQISEVKECTPHEEINTELSYTTMTDFCKALYHDIASNFDAWVNFGCFKDVDLSYQSKRLRELLDRLKAAIRENTKKRY